MTEVRCLRCRRVLQNARARRLGIGPGCLRKMDPRALEHFLAEKYGQLNLFDAASKENEIVARSR